MFVATDGVTDVTDVATDGVTDVTDVATDGVTDVTDELLVKTSTLSATSATKSTAKAIIDLLRKSILAT